MKNNHPEAREVNMQEYGKPCKHGVDWNNGCEDCAEEVAEDVSDEQAVKAVYPDAKIGRDHHSAYYAFTKTGAGGRISEHVGSDALAWKSARSKLKPEPTPAGSTCQYCSDYGCHSCPSAEPGPTHLCETCRMPGFFNGMRWEHKVPVRHPFIAAEPTPVRTAKLEDLSKILGVGQKFPDLQEEALRLVNLHKSQGEHKGNKHADLMYALDVIVNFLRVREVGSAEELSVCGNMKLEAWPKDEIIRQLKNCHVKMGNRKSEIVSLLRRNKDFKAQIVASLAEVERLKDLLKEPNPPVAPVREAESDEECENCGRAFSLHPIISEEGPDCYVPKLKFEPKPTMEPQELPPTKKCHFCDEPATGSYGSIHCCDDEHHDEQAVYESRRPTDYEKLQTALARAEKAEAECRMAGIGDYQGNYYLGNLTTTGSLREHISGIEAKLEKAEALNAELRALLASAEGVGLTQAERIGKLEEALSKFLLDPSFDVHVGGNPNAILKMIESARELLK